MIDIRQRRALITTPNFPRHTALGYRSRYCDIFMWGRLVSNTATHTEPIRNVNSMTFPADNTTIGYYASLLRNAQVNGMDWVT